VIAAIPFRWQGAVDFLVLAAVLYFILRWAQQARALRIALGVVGLHAGALGARYVDLVITSWILESAAIIFVVLLVMFFHPELRRALMRLDSVLRLWPGSSTQVGHRMQAVSDAAFRLAHSGLGALMVLVRQDSIAELLEGGSLVDAEPSPELLIAIFQKVSPLHDGAVVLKENRIARAGVVLPLTERSDVPAYYGTRHRAALGLAERSDALVVVVSEERRKVTLVNGRTASVVGSADELAGALRKLQGSIGSTPAGRLRRIFLSHMGFKFAALGLAGLFWAGFSLPRAATVRMISAPVEFANVPAGMRIAQQSAYSVEVQLRASSWIMDSVGLGRIVARFDLSKAGEGWVTLPTGPYNFDLPPGVTVDRVIPKEVSVRLSRRP
jgi:uncharacterized protein (TIGR00159 family)